MAITKTLDQYIHDKSKFDFTDIFGKGRIRKAMYEYYDLKKHTKDELEKNKLIMYSQAQSVTDLVAKVRSLEDENKYLKDYIRVNDGAKNNLWEKKNAAEKTIEDQSSQIEKLEDENTMLSAKLQLLQGDFDELSKLHEKLVSELNEHPDRNFVMEGFM